MTDREIKERVANFRIKFAAAIHASMMRPARAFEVGLREGFERGRDTAHKEDLDNMKALMAGGAQSESRNYTK